MSYVISDHNVLVHSVLPSLHPGCIQFFSFLFIPGHNEHPPPVHVCVCVSVSLAFPTCSFTSTALCCITDLWPHLCEGIFRPSSRLLYSSFCLLLFRTLCSLCSVLFWMAAFSVSTNPPPWTWIILGHLMCPPTSCCFISSRWLWFHLWYL